MPNRPQETTRSSETTRQALLDAAIHLFGKNGYSGTSTRAIAQRAETNVASIAYHFGGKSQLHLACAEEIARRISTVFENVDQSMPDTPERAEAAFETILSQFVRMILMPKGASHMVPFMLRELSEHSAVIDEIYKNVMGPRHRELCRLWELATGCPAESEETKLAVFSLLGQVLYFRIGMPIVLRRMEWDEIDSAHAEKINATLTRTLHATIAAHREATK